MSAEAPARTVHTMHQSPAPYSILFVAPDPGRVRYFEPVLELLAARGHTIHVAIERYRARIAGQFDFLESFAERYPSVSFGPVHKRDKDHWEDKRRALRSTLEWLHYERPIFDASPDFRARAESAAPERIVRALKPFMRLASVREVTDRAVRRLERDLPHSAHAERFIAEHGPDLVMVTPLVWFGASQTDWIRAAQALGVRTIGCMFSWDNLTSKGRLLSEPDVVTVWNAAQRHEASVVHGLNPHRAEITGAQNWDHWFDWSPSRSREELCAEIGLRADRPYVLYLESSGYVGGEAAFVGEWVDALRASGNPLLADVPVLVRPHPQVVDDVWDRERVTERRDTAVWPRAGEVPLDRRTRSNFFDSLYHSAAVVGVNTSAFIEAAIVGRPCLTLTLPRFRKGQTSTVHFHHLRRQNGGPLLEAADIETHLAQLAESLAQPLPDRSAEPFIDAFVRPLGRDVAAAPRLVAAVEELCAMSAPTPVPTTRPQRALRQALERGHTLGNAKGG